METCPPTVPCQRRDSCVSGHCRETGGLQGPRAPGLQLVPASELAERLVVWNRWFLGPALRPGAGLAKADIQVDRAFFVPGPKRRPRDLSGLPRIPWAPPSAASTTTGQETPHAHAEGHSQSAGSSQGCGLPGFPLTFGGSFFVSLVGHSIFFLTIFLPFSIHIRTRHKMTTEI